MGSDREDDLDIVADSLLNSYEGRDSSGGSHCSGSSSAHENLFGILSDDGKGLDPVELERKDVGVVLKKDDGLASGSSKELSRLRRVQTRFRLLGIGDGSSEGNLDELKDLKSSGVDVFLEELAGWGKDASGGRGEEVSARAKRKEQRELLTSKSSIEHVTSIHWRSRHLDVETGEHGFGGAGRHERKDNKMSASSSRPSMTSPPTLSLCRTHL